MKKVLLTTTVLWIITIVIVIGVLFKADVDKNTYKIKINRIHSRLSSDMDSNENIIKNLSREDLGIISSVKIIDYKNASKTKEENFFKINDLNKNTSVYLPIERSNYLVKYSIKTYSGRKIKEIVLICGIITILFLTFLGFIIYTYKYIIKPMKKLSLVPKRLATGYIDKLTVSYKHQYFNDFIWGLDMLREKLQDERNRNYELEKQRKTLVASLSHDIKTPLSSIKNYTIALSEDVYEKPSEQKKALNIILDKTEVIEKLTKELLESSIQDINTNALKVNKKEVYMSDIHKRLNQIIYQKIDLLHMEYQSCELKKDLLVVADLDALSQVFDNIVENAIKYGDLNRIKVSYHKEEYCQFISIENTGQSIAETEIKHIFSSYYRGSNIKDQPGYGLGLYICKKTMQALEGDIYAQNTETGVRFVIVVKLAS
ncbi:MAG: HAMP domain-containing histidine kinase [Firmicutes bacterium]|nr:HAMP domain-containing histidine kinase [Bacillota bacterium]